MPRGYNSGYNAKNILAYIFDLRSGSSNIYIYIYLFFTHTYCPPDYFKHLYYKREAFFSVHYTVLGRILSFLRFSSNTNQNSYEVLGRAFGPQFFVGFS